MTARDGRAMDASLSPLPGAAARVAAGRRMRGLHTVELALVLPVFLLTVFAVLDLSRLLFTEIALQYAMREGGRFGVTGRQLPDPAHPETLQTRLASIRQVVRNAAIGVKVDPNAISVSSVAGGAGNAGGPGDTLVISLTYEFQFATPLIGRYFNNGSYTFTTSTSFRNEPFPPGTST